MSRIHESMSSALAGSPGLGKDPELGKWVPHRALVRLLACVSAHVDHQHVLGFEGPQLSGAAPPMAHELLPLPMDVLTVDVLKEIQRLSEVPFCPRVPKQTFPGPLHPTSFLLGSASWGKRRQEEHHSPHLRSPTFLKQSYSSRASAVPPGHSTSDLGILGPPALSLTLQCPSRMSYKIQPAFLLPPGAHMHQLLLGVKFLAAAIPAAVSLIHRFGLRLLLSLQVLPPIQHPQQGILGQRRQSKGHWGDSFCLAPVSELKSPPPYLCACGVGAGHITLQGLLWALANQRVQLRFQLPQGKR